MNNIGFDMLYNPSERESIGSIKLSSKVKDMQSIDID